MPLFYSHERAAVARVQLWTGEEHLEVRDCFVGIDGDTVHVWRGADSPLPLFSAPRTEVLITWAILPAIHPRQDFHSA